MPRSHTAEIVVDVMKSPEECPDRVDTEAEPDLDLPPLPPPRPGVA